MPPYFDFILLNVEPDSIVADIIYQAYIKNKEKYKNALISLSKVPRYYKIIQPDIKSKLVFSLRYENHVLGLKCILLQKNEDLIDDIEGLGTQYSKQNKIVGGVESLLIETLLSFKSKNAYNKVENIYYSVRKCSKRKIYKLYIIEGLDKFPISNENMVPSKILKIYKKNKRIFHKTLG